MLDFGWIGLGICFAGGKMVVRQLPLLRVFGADVIPTSDLCCN